MDAAENGEAALELIVDRRPDLVLLDLMMPIMDGFEFLLEFRSRRECRHVPIIVITAKDLTAEDRKRLVGGVEMIVEKGAMTRSQLLDRVSELVADIAGGESPP